MDLTNYMLLACERNMLTNKFGIDVFYRAFNEATRASGVETGGAAGDYGRPLLVKDNFFLALKYLSEAIYAERAKEERIGAFEIMFQEML